MGSNGRDSRVVAWRECEFEVDCSKKGMKFEPLDMQGGGGRSNENSAAACMSRISDVEMGVKEAFERL